VKLARGIHSPQGFHLRFFQVCECEHEIHHIERKLPDLEVTSVCIAKLTRDST